MHYQLDLVDAQINEHPNGSIEILGQRTMIVVTGLGAEQIKSRYAEFKASHPTREDLKISINIEIPQPIGVIVNES
jgi:hypothetical protein